MRPHKKHCYVSGSMAQTGARAKVAASGRVPPAVPLYIRPYKFSVNRMPTKGHLCVFLLSQNG